MPTENNMPGSCWARMLKRNSRETMSRNIQGVRGMNDLFPDTTQVWQRVESVLRETGWLYGYREIRTPLLERTDLFSQSIGGGTDIVEKEMYTFVDQGRESLSLRPEATASTVRACIQHGLLHNRQQRFWYLGPMFRRERPQKGRYRQFHQFGIEAFGWSGPDIDAEIIQVGERILRTLGVDGITLEINTLGSESSRIRYRRALTGYLLKHQGNLDEDSRSRLERNPLRILDSKNPQTRRILAEAPVLRDYLEPDERLHFTRLCTMLEDSGVRYSINDRLVRGLDYYTSTVFEWTTSELGAQAAVCAGGRYDSLVESRGGRSTPGIGFAMGLERLIELVQLGGNEGNPAHADIYVIDTTGDSVPSTRRAEALRDIGIRVISHCGGGKLANQLKRADQSGAILALITGEREAELGVVQVKPMRQNIGQIELPADQIVNWCQDYLNDFRTTEARHDR